MNFFCSAVDRLETLAATLGAGLQAWGEPKTIEKLQTITREFINRRLIKANGMNGLSSNMNLIMLGAEKDRLHYFSIIMCKLP